MKKISIQALLFIILLTLGTQDAFAEKFHGQFIDWALFSNGDEDEGKEENKVCYMTSLPIKSSGNAYSRGQPYIIITKTSNKIPEVSISAGYHYKNNSEVSLSFGLKKFTMITYRSLAWAYSLDDDIELIKALRTSDDVVISTISNRNQTSRDTYSLVGFEKAYRELQNICN